MSVGLETIKCVEENTGLFCDLDPKGKENKSNNKQMGVYRLLHSNRNTYSTKGNQQKMGLMSKNPYNSATETQTIRLRTWSGDLHRHFSKKDIEGADRLKNPSGVATSSGYWRKLYSLSSFPGKLVFWLAPFQHVWDNFLK